MILRTSVKVDNNTCFTTDTNYGQNLICFPHSSLQFSKLNCTTFVSTFYSQDNQRSNMFPDYISNTSQALSEPSQILSDNLIGLSINNQSLRLEDSLIRVEFHHYDVDVREAFNEGE